MNIIINGNKCGKINIQRLKHILFGFIDVKYSPLEALKSNIEAFFDLVSEFCKVEKKSVYGADKAKLTREINAIDNQRKYWRMIQSKDVFVKKYYDFILNSEQLSTLRGFGRSNAFGDNLKGNPEIQRLSFKHSD